VACAINLGSSLILTGGFYSLTRVSEYGEAGFIRFLPDLNQERWGHGCSFYENAEGTKTFLVSGGSSGNDYLSSTELLVGAAPAWIFSGELPSPRLGLRGANIDNKIFMIGGGGYGGYDYLDDILEFDPLTGQWELVDRMIQARNYHAVSVINNFESLCLN